VTHEDVQELLGAYALDAVEVDEAEQIEAHLSECPRCRAEVIELREVAALIGNSGADAPPGIWERIASSLDETPPALRLVVATSKRRRVLNLAGMAAAAAILVVVAFSVARLRSEVDDLRNARRADQVALAAQDAMTEQGARVARLATDDGRGAIAVVRSNGQGYFIASALPQPAHIYELWGATSNGEVVALGTMPGSGVYAFTADSSVKTVMVTEEEHPVSTPTTPAILTGSLA
jgi:hypothetical protein